MTVPVCRGRSCSPPPLPCLACLAARGYETRPAPTPPTPTWDVQRLQFGRYTVDDLATPRDRDRSPQCGWW